MITGKLNIKELLEAFDSTSSQLLQLASSFTGKEFSTIPFAGNWTAAQVCEHIIKSNESIAQALKEKGKTTVREPGQRVLELQELFLNFTKKFQSPKAVLPAKDGYKK
ncbi:MAG: DinB family protein [Segetibacter sp.]|nr:DinB family protein [Segetibacter sp.]